MVKSKWIVNFLGIEPNLVDGDVKQVYLIVKLDKCLLTTERSIYKEGDQVALHLRNVIINDLGITDLNVFDNKYCKKLSSKIKSGFVIIEEEGDNFNLVSLDCLKNAIVAI